MSDTATLALGPVTPIPVPASLLGESPLWHGPEAALYWCDIPGRKLNRYHPASGQHQQWAFDTDVACVARVDEASGGGLAVAQRDGLWRFNPATGERTLLASPPYETARERFNDGKPDPQGRWWVGTIYEPRDPALAALYRFAGGQLDRMADGVTTSNGLGWSPDGSVQYWSDTKTHTVFAMDFDAATGNIGPRRVFASFPLKQAGQDLNTYGGRPDGAAVDVEGCYWAAMFEGSRVVRLSPTGEVLQSLDLPVRCPTMPTFGGDDLQTLYITTARENRPADELAAQPWAGQVLQVRVGVPGLPANALRL